MNDRFKFRFFETYNNTMLDCKDYDFNEILESGKPVMQCTGMKDKNGKLIYEGDIINIWCKNYTKNQISEVKFCKERAAFTFDYFTDYGNIVPCTMEKTEIVVIGNIYENPELLEDTECQKN